MKSCPTTEQLRRLLEETRVPDAAETADEQHVENCANCQQRIDVLLDSEIATQWQDLLTESHDHHGAALTTWSGQLTSGDQAAFPVIPGYTIEAQIGRGGMGIVFAAHDTKLNRRVAIKVLAGGFLAGPERLARFRREAETSARLHHSGIVQIFNIGESNGLPYLVLEFVDGPNLRQAVNDDGCLTPRRAAELLVKLSDAVACAHQQAVIHRDLKPENVLLTSGSADVSVVASDDIQPHVADFGLARLLDHDDATGTGQLLGTPAWMAPEVASGTANSVTEQIDVYGLGAILYFALTGQPPFTGDTATEILAGVRNHRPVSPRAMNAQVPLDLAVIALKCLEKQSQHRYSSVTDLADDLRRFLDKRPILARPVTVIDRLRRWCVRRPLHAIGAFLGVAACVAITAVAAHIVEERTQNTYFQTIAQAHAAWDANDHPEAQRLLDDCPQRLRSWDWQLLRSLTAGSGTILRNFGVPVRSVAVTDDGSICAVATADGKVTVLSITTQEAIRDVRIPGAGPIDLVLHPAGTHLLAWRAGEAFISAMHSSDPPIRLDGPEDVSAGVFVSADEVVLGGRRGGIGVWANGSMRTITETLPAAVIAVGAGETEICALAEDNQLYRWQRGAIEDPPQVTRLADGDVSQATFTRNADLVAVYKSQLRDDDTDVIDVASGRRLRSYLGDPGGTHDLAFSSDGEFLALCGTDGAIRSFSVRSRQTAEWHRSLRQHDSAVRSLAFIGTSSRIVSGDQDGQLRVATLTPPRGLNFTDTAHHTFSSGHTEEIRTVCVDHAGVRFATGGEDGRVVVRETPTGTPATGTPTVVLPEHPDFVRGCAFNSTDELLATACDDGIVRVFEVKTGVLKWTLSGGQLNNTCLAWSPDDQFLAVGSGGHDRDIIVWHTSTQEIAMRLAGHERTVRDMDFSSDGRFLVSAGGPSLRIWEIDGTSSSPKPVSVIDAHAGRSLSCMFVHGNQRIVSAGNDGLVRIWNVADGSLLHEIRCAQSGRPFIAVSPDESRIVAHTLDATRVIDIATGRVCLQFAQGSTLPRRSVIGTNGTLVSCCSDHMIRVWRVD